MGHKVILSVSKFILFVTLWQCVFLIELQSVYKEATSGLSLKQPDLSQERCTG